MYVVEGFLLSFFCKFQYENNKDILVLYKFVYISLLWCWLLQHTLSLSGTVHTRVEVCRMNSEMSRLVEWPWLQLICCIVCLPHGHNFRWRRESLSGSEYWLVCCCWTLEIEFNESLSLLIIRLVNYSITTSVKIVDGGLYFIFSFHFILFFWFSFRLFSIFRTVRVRGYQSCCHISHNLMAWSQDWLRDIREGSRRFWNKVMSYSMDNTCWPHVILMVV